MTSGDGDTARRPLHVYSLGLLRNRRIRRMLELAGWRVTTGWPGRDGRIAVWGQKRIAARGHWVARTSGAGILTLEDGFLRSLQPGVSGAPPRSIIADDLGIYFDSRAPSRLERLIAEGCDRQTLDRAAPGIAALMATGLSKYTPAGPRRDFGRDYVLVVDQTHGDASIAGAGASRETFHRMLDAARTENRGSRLIVKGHPDVAAGARRGNLEAAHLTEDEDYVSGFVNPWDLIDGARAVYTVSSQMGYEAVLAGRPVRCFGTGFYTGWGLTEDEHRCDRRSARVSRDALFAACHLRYPLYYDVWRDRLCDFETALDSLHHEHCARDRGDTTEGDVFSGIRLWKRRNVLGFVPKAPLAPVFEDRPERAIDRARQENRHLWIWASKAPRARPSQGGDDGHVGYIEDGFLRSVGLGAELTEAASLIFDRTGIYFDPDYPSDLEHWIVRAVRGEADVARAMALREMIVRSRVTKYNLPAGPDTAPAGGHWAILVPGQVEDDASIIRGTQGVSTNLALLQETRSRNPTATIVYKPHPDVEAGLRAGAIPRDIALSLADDIAERQSADELLERVDQVWTMTSSLGFEALLRGKAVSCFGMPFYAGWGLTTDLDKTCPRRTERPSLDQMVWATLIAYPRYRDPVTGLACPPELVVERLAAKTPMRSHRSLSKLQGLLASAPWLWRR